MDDPPASQPPRNADDGAADDSVDWAEVRRAYELSEETVSSIRERFGLSRYQLAQRRTAESWTARPQIARRGLTRRRASIGSQALVYRLNRLVTIGLAMLEKQISDEGMTENNARTLTELCRAQEIRMRSNRNHKAAKAREKKNNDAGHDFRDDPEWLLAEINRRLDRLGKHVASQTAGDPAGGAEEERAAGA